MLISSSCEIKISFFFDRNKDFFLKWFDRRGLTGRNFNFPTVRCRETAPVLNFYFSRTLIGSGARGREKKSRVAPVAIGQHITRDFPLFETRKNRLFRKF